VREPVGGRAAGGPAEGGDRLARDPAGDLFFGLPGENVDGGEYAAAALEAGAWGVVVEPHWVDDLFGTKAARSSPPRRRCPRSARSRAAGGRTSRRS
jgi:UDP-N-acetylmuramoyl-tripeptide--D-alanyl-D-alanine ligase